MIFVSKMEDFQNYLLYKEPASEGWFLILEDFEGCLREKKEGRKEKGILRGA